MRVRTPSRAAAGLACLQPGCTFRCQSLEDPAAPEPLMDQSVLRVGAQLGHQSSPLRVAEDVAAAGSDRQRAVQRPGTRSERPPGDACAQLGSPTFSAPVGRVGPRGHGKRTRNPQRYRRHTATNNDHHRPKSGRGTSKVSLNF